MLNILIPLDGSELAEYAVPHAIAIASRFVAKVTLLRIVTPGEFRSEDAFSRVDWRLSRHQAKTYLQSIAESCEVAGIACDLCIEEGRPAEVILSKADELDTHLLVLSTHGRGEATDFPSGGVVGKILSKFDRSILLVRGAAGSSPEKKARMSCIGVPVDGSNQSDCALRVAVMLAEATHASLAVACIAAPPALPPLLRTDSKAALLCRELEELTRAAAERLLVELRAQIPSGIKLQTSVVLNSSPGNTIGDVLRRLDADFFVASEGFFEGASATRGVLAAGVPTPILILSPSGIGTAFCERRVIEDQVLPNADVS